MSSSQDLNDAEIPSEVNTSEKSLEDISTKELWDDIGFHRPIAGFWYKLIFEILIIIIPIFLTTLFLQILYPFPTSIGYRTTFTSIFVLVFQVFDIGTSNTISRFIADENIKNPNKMVQYIQYFVWYQAITGLVQITVISIWALYYVPDTELAYGIWIMLICITKQWPGFPGVFKGALNALQQFNKKATIDFIQGEGIQRITEIVFVLLGKWYGATHPEIGELLGISMGAVFGLYIDDIIASIFAAWYLSKTLEDYNITFKRLFGWEFDWALVKECFTFGLKTGLPGILFASTKVLTLNWSLQVIPQYTTFIVLQDMAYSLVAMSSRLTNQDFTPLYTESYQNGKIKLCQYYNAHALRFLMVNTGFAVAAMISVIPILELAFVGLGLDRYVLTVPFILPSLLNRSFKSFKNYPNGILIGANKPNQHMALSILEELLKMLSLYLTIVVFRVPDMGIWGIVYTLTLGDFPAILIKTVIAYIYINKKVFKMKLMLWQTFCVPLMSTIILYSIFRLLKIVLIEPLWDWNIYVSLAVGVVGLIVLVFVFYFPLTVLLGGWDENSIRDFNKVQKMSGPSSFIVKPLAKVIFKTVKISKLHNRFKYDETDALKEIRELVEFRNKNREQLNA